MLSISVLGIVVFLILNARRLKLFRGHLFSNSAYIMLFISDAQYYIPEHIKLEKHILWDVIEIDWKEVNMPFNGNKINLPASVSIPLRDEFKIRHIIK